MENDKKGYIKELHRPVMVEAVMEYLAPEAGCIYLDMTVGSGGHTEKIAQKIGEKGRIIGLDRDSNILAMTQKRLADFKNVTLQKSLFSQATDVLDQLGIEKIHGVLMDLGVSSYQLDSSERGFSHSNFGPLDMRMDSDQKLTAARIVNTWSIDQLEDIFRKYGEEPRAKRIAAAIVKERKNSEIRFTIELADIVKKSAGYPWGKIHPATRIFQALRIAVNGELTELENSLPLIFDRLDNDGRLVILSYHSLEDRIVKLFFKEKQRSGSLVPLTLKPKTPDINEIEMNRRSRSAKLRAGQRKGEGK